jgi:2-methylcitrate dehydratase PrpD
MLIAQQLARFASQTRFEDLPADVVSESARILLDSIGCAIAAGGDTKGRIGIEFAGILGNGSQDATIFGAKHRSSVFGAAFANGELINALDFDAILPPGHVSPYVLPGALAIAEAHKASGRDLLVAVAIAHELANRFGKGMDYIRDVIDGVFRMPGILGYTSTIFGATAAITSLRSADETVSRHAMAIAAATTPVNSHRSWIEHVPVASIKYTMAGPIVQGALTAAHMALLGHTGDPGIFDDPEFGYPRIIGTVRWKPENIVAGIGEQWNFQRENSFKVYPHCRSLHGLIDLLNELQNENQIAPSEIEAIRAWGEGHVERACWTTHDIHSALDGQFSMAHGLAVGAQQLPRCKVWQVPETIFAPHVLELMGKVTYATHPEWASAIVNDPAARPSRVEVDARGQTFTATLRYPKGTPGTAGGVGMSDGELADKFRLNCERVLANDVVERAIDGFMNLPALDDVAPLLRSLQAV